MVNTIYIVDRIDRVVSWNSTSFRERETTKQSGAEEKGSSMERKEDSIPYLTKRSESKRSCFPPPWSLRLELSSKLCSRVSR